MQMYHHHSINYNCNCSIPRKCTTTIPITHLQITTIIVIIVGCLCLSRPSSVPTASKICFAWRRCSVEACKRHPKRIHQNPPAAHSPAAASALPALSKPVAAMPARTLLSNDVRLPAPQPPHAANNVCTTAWPSQSHDGVQFPPPGCALTMPSS